MAASDLSRAGVLLTSASASWLRRVTSSLRYARLRCAEAVFVVMNSSCAISRLVLPAAASRATRSSLAVRASRPVIASRRGLAPAAMSSALAWRAMRRAPQ